MTNIDNNFDTMQCKVSFPKDNLLLQYIYA